MSGDNIRITALDHHDAATAERIHAVLLPAYAQEAALLQAQPFPPLDRTVHDIQRSRDSFTGAWRGDELLGAVSVGADDEPGQRCVSMLVVHPRHQCQGVARRLMTDLLQREPRHGHAVSTGARNIPALALYAQLGFSVYRQGLLGALQMVKLRRPATQPAMLDHAGIAARVPHSGRMCLLDRLLDWSPAHITCSATSHRDADNPLRSPAGLLAPVAIEYAAQAMALHGTLSAAPGSAPTPGFLASVRAVRLRVPRLDGVASDLRVSAHKQAGDARQALYTFTLQDDAGALLVDGRATVVLNALP